MITLFASIAGFMGSLLPEFIKYFKDINDKKHILNMLDKQIKITRQDNIDSLRVLENQYIEGPQDLNYNSDIPWVNALNASVRPLLAYGFFIMYLGVKYMQYSGISCSGNVYEYIDIIWTQDDRAIFASVISFYYGQRTFRNLWQKNSK